MAEQPIRVGMEVFGSDGLFVGRVKEVTADALWIDRTLKRDIWVPRRAVHGVIEDHITLAVRADQAGNLGPA
ncbi:MAG TPA: DUF2171 domain-containing protein [Chloroflexota bacterium]|nr:DUF2171 domain-containing protein [Chloroflexota bacterium]